MLFTFDKTTKEITVCKNTDFKGNKILERQDMEKWVENYPEILGEELLIISTEYDRFDKTKERIDVLALDREGNLVIIELKRDDSGDSVDMQAIKYAAYCSTLTLNETADLFTNYLNKKGEKINLEQAKKRIIDFIEDDEFEELSDKPRVIIAAKEFRAEVTSTVLWLNKCGLDITCVRLTPYKINNDFLGIESNILIPLPETKDFLIKAQRKETAQQSKSVTQEEYVSFFKELNEKFTKKIPVDLPAPFGNCYQQIPTGIACVHFEWSFHGRPRSSFGVELHFEKGNSIYNHSMVKKIKRHKNEIEKATGEKLIIQEDWGKKHKIWSRIFIEKQEGKMTEELLHWAAEKMETLYKILEPELLNWDKKV